MPAAPSSSFAFSQLSWVRFTRDTLWPLLFREIKSEEDFSREAAWQRYWGDSYGLGLKESVLKPVFEMLELEGKLGELVVDAGSGAQPATRYLPARPGRKRICVDIAADNKASAGVQNIRLDAEKAGESGALSFRKALLRVCKFLEISPGTETNPRRADTIVFSDLLNYVDFRKVLGRFTGYLKPGGRIVVMNLPMRGNQALFSENGLKDNRDLYRFLEQNHFEIEYKSFPFRLPAATDEAEELILLVARKCP